MAMSDIFNVSFFILLGIMVLIVSLLVVYFETKIRAQNHKMGSMLSLVSTLAEDMNSMKNGMNYLAQMNKEQQNDVQQDNTMNGGLGNNVKLVKTDLIDVSDNEEESEEEDSEESHEEESDEEDSDESDEEDSDESDEEESDESDESEEEKQYILNDIDDDEEHTHNIVEELEDFTNEDTVKVVNIHSENEEVPTENIDNVINVEKIIEVDMEHLEENMIPTMDDLKSISIHIDGQLDGQVDEGVSGETNNEMIDYKKLNLPKLRSIAMEKGLEDTSKLKKQELIELLENTK